MMRFHVVAIVAAALAAAGAVRAQDAGLLSSEAKQAYQAIQKNLVAMAEKMPEEQYGFKPAPEIRAFGELVAHVADAQARFCSASMGEQKAVNAAQKKTKAELVAALKESFAICDAAHNALTDANAAQMVDFFRGKRSRLGVLAANTAHSNEEYGYMAVYLRLKGIVPPSSAR